VSPLSWRARIDGVRGTTLGAGSLVNSRFVLTTAQVVHGVDEALVTFPGTADGLRASVVWRGPWRCPGDTGDVAVLALDKPAPVEPALLGALGALRPRDGLTSYGLRAMGFPDGHERDGTHVTLRTSADRLLRREWLELDGAEPRLREAAPGFGGAAVYWPESGRIAGLLTTAAETDGEAPAPRMLPLETLRRYWEGLDDLLPLEWLGREPRALLRDLLAGAEPAGGLAGAFRQAFPSYLRTPGPFGSAWEAVRYVGEEMHGDDRLWRFLSVLSAGLDDGTRRAVAEWIHTWLPGGTAPSPALPVPDGMPATSVIVRLEPMTRGAGLEVTVSVLANGVPTARGGPVRAGRTKVRDKVEALIAGQLEQLHDVDWMAEFVVPEGLLSTPFEEWSVREPQARRPRPLRTVPLVVRHVDRLKPLAVSRLTRRRWETLRARGTTRPHPVDCRLGYGYDEFHDWLDADGDLCALAYASCPDPEWLAAALDTGVPVMLWRRAPCAAPGHGECDPGPYLDLLHGTVAALPPDALPVEVMRLRKEARSPAGGGEDHCGHLLTLFWDDPARTPDPPLAMGRS
jgi:hypothetical protein